MLVINELVLNEKQQAKQDAILAAALQLFAQKGFHGTAVPDVAQLAGVATGTIYRYFSSKEALVNAVFQQAKQCLYNTLNPADFDFKANPRQLFSLLWQRLCLFSKTQPLAFRFLELQDHVPYLDEKSKAIESQVLIPIWTYCVMAIQKKAARDMPAEALMALIWGAFVGLIKAEYMGYIVLNEQILAQAEQACWASFSC
ncbi:MAG: TetR/AcrR family transcriptional regulator [Agitococcus sp.]|jgi:AcrR family transcriptional regulator|nr:TetR/AcrR family transcriptional regulator [Moraxellaceae bacterium]MBP9216045.1 TetR/AcrR family transcriptional regulator [Agitococcus sp.]MBK7300346.1 TetR/AcrR family transcriptional regulator [Moraxellaceae bacterium]MBK8327112.1 TetR/AcrR family transcriptional regulator [Moraxellaceae bacterium]MBK9185404.1 TetR/AcrR family transcriptional regulator [Moraxellaceae bacterium]